MSIKRIAISRTDAIGDVILTLPLAGLLKSLHSNCQLIFLGRTYTQSVVACCPHIDEFINMDAIEKLSFEEQTRAFENLHLDAIIHVLPNKQIARLAKNAHIPLRIGTTNRIHHWKSCNKLVPLSRRKSSLHEAQLNFKLAYPLGAKSDYTLAEVLSFQRFEVPQKSFSIIDKQKFNIVLHPKSNGSGREWGLNNFAELIRLLPPNLFKIFITGTATEGDIIRQTLLGPFEDKVVNLTGKQSLEEFISFLSQTDAILAAGTGPLHIGAALGIHAIGLFPPIKPIHPARWAPLGHKTKVFVNNDRNCKKICLHDTRACVCMKKILPHDILKYLLELQSSKE
ncbi:MAG: glycosyltransferase family 9 protein [Bacteroidales bacterium]